MGACTDAFTFELSRGMGDKPPRRGVFVISNVDKWQQKTLQGLLWIDGWIDRFAGLCFKTTSCGLSCSETGALIVAITQGSLGGCVIPDSILFLFTQTAQVAWPLAITVSMINRDETCAFVTPPSPSCCEHIDLKAMGGSLIRLMSQGVTAFAKYWTVLVSLLSPSIVALLSHEGLKQECDVCGSLIKHARP